MRHTAIALLLAAAAGQASGQEASTELYGEFRYSYNHVDAGDTTHWASANNASRFGVRGEVSGRKVTAFVDLQTGVSIDAEESGATFTQRYYLAGVRGGFGTLTVGRHSTAYKAAGLRLDPFYDTSTLSAGGGVPTTGLFAGATFGLSPLTNGWADRAVAYTTPSLKGVTANAAAYLDTDSDHDFGLGLGYRGRGLDAGVQYHDSDGGRTWTPAAAVDHAVRGHASYTRTGRWSLGGTYERLEARTGESQDYAYGVGTLYLIPGLMLAGAVGYVEDSGAVQPVSGTAFHGGVFYTLLPQARVHALYSRLDRADDAPGRGNLALGLTYQFSLRR